MSAGAFEWLNYHHLLYFWLVAREGGLKRAGAVLRVSHSTVATQVHALEDALGEKLFVREGRRLVLTELGNLVFRYAGDIFSLGREMLDAVRDRPSGRPLRLEVGVADSLPKLVVHRLLAPARALAQPIHLVCREGKHDRLVLDLAANTVDLVLADTPLPTGSRVRAFSHPLGDCGVSFCAAPALAKRLRRGRFPQTLDKAPFLLPTDNSALRRALDQWFARNGVRPEIVGEFEDAALLHVFGADGMGVFPAATIIERDLRRHYDVRTVGRATDLKARFFALSLARRLEHPAVVAIAGSAQAAVG